MESSFMPKVGRVELSICKLEGFLVQIKYHDGANVRSDREGIPSWPYDRAARDSWTVSDWKQNRFAKTYPGFAVDVLDGDRNVAAGQMHLENVRDSYED
jgi:hypothetical protein